jgi:hypothetical protein
VNVEVPIPALLAHQELVVKHPARFKVLRKGRRWGKDRLAFNVSWFGHGPSHQWAGILDGWDVAWLAPDFKQGRGIWNEEVISRFADTAIPGISVNLQEKTVLLQGCGGLYFYSAENARAIRGLGKRLKGIVINEAAHLDLAHIWRQIVRPVLADNEGWAIIMSTTNSGADGGKDDQGNAQIPSFFNTLCEQIRQGQRSEEWHEFYGTAEENPKIKPSEFKSLVAEYPEGSTALNEEIYAKLLAPGAGLAFPEWRDSEHTLEEFTVPSHWEYGAGFDWGYWQPSVLTIVAHGEDHRSVCISDHLWTRKDGQELGKEIAAICKALPKPPAVIAADSSIWGEQASKGFPNLAEEINTGIARNWPEQSFPPQLIAVPKGANSRITRANLLHRYLKTPARLKFLKRATNCVSTIPKLALDPKKPEDVDTTANDHAYDSLTYFLLSRPPLVDAPERQVEADTHPGYTRWGERVMSKTERQYKQSQLEPHGKRLVEVDV